MKIACVIDEGFEDSEFKQPFDALSQAGHEVVLIGLKPGEITGKKGEVRTRTTTTVAEVSPDQFGALFIPGGASPDHLRADPAMVAFVREFAALDRPILAVCHGPQLLIAADAIKERRLTAWKTIQVDLQHMKEDVVDEEVVVDGNLVTSRQPSDLDAFIRESMRILTPQPVSAR